MRIISRYNLITLSHHDPKTQTHHHPTHRIRPVLLVHFKLRHRAWRRPRHQRRWTWSAESGLVELNEINRIKIFYQRQVRSCLLRQILRGKNFCRDHPRHLQRYRTSGQPGSLMVGFAIVPSIPRARTIRRLDRHRKSEKYLAARKYPFAQDKVGSQSTR